MAGPESKVQSRVIAILEARGFEVIKTIATNKRGVSDVIACAPNGTFWALEIKGSPKLPTPLQRLFLHRIKERGGVSAVIWDASQIYALFSKYLP